MPAFTYEFQELPLVREGALVTARVDGLAVIDYDDDSLDWDVATLVLAADNDKYGDEAQEGSIEVRSGSLWWSLIEAALKHHRMDAIDEEIADLVRNDRLLDHSGSSYARVAAMAAQSMFRKQMGH